MRGRPLAFWLAVSGVSLMSLASLNILADHFPHSGFGELRDYVTRRNG